MLFTVPLEYAITNIYIN